MGLFLKVLRRIATSCSEYARLGVEEFAIYLVDVRREDVEALAGELCRVVREQPTRRAVAISIGLARVEDYGTPSADKD